MSIWSSINFLPVICSPTVLLFFSREATTETYGPRVSFSYYLPLRSILFAFYFQIINPKNPKYFAALFLFVIYLSNLLQLSPAHSPISDVVTRKGLKTPLNPFKQLE